MLQLQPCSHCGRTFFPDRDVRNCFKKAS
jgi:uncharacterized OB-fold protein